MRLRALPDGDDEAPGIVVSPAADDASHHPLLAAAREPTEPLVGAIGQLRLHLSGVRHTDGSPAKLIAIAGIDASEEAALVTAALAVSNARAGYQTLLVDACLRRPMLHRLFGCSNVAGVTTLLPKRLPASAIQQTGQPRLTFLSSGPRVEDDRAVFDGARLFGLLRTQEERVESILVLSDGEPGIIAGASEGFDGTILVVRRDVTPLRHLRAATRALAERGTRLVGVVCAD